MSIDFDRIRAENIDDYGKKTSHLRRFQEEMYPEKTHFVQELIQNADDAEASKFKLLLDEDKIIAINNGLPFSEQDVKDICSIAETSKDIDKIGTFGIGFKSVYSVTNKPEIYSGGHHFYIEYYIRPYSLPGPAKDVVRDKDVDLGQTVFVLRFDEEIITPQEKQKIAAGLHLNLRSLLFLQYLHEITLIDRIDRSTVTLLKEEEPVPDPLGNIYRITRVRLLEVEKEREELWLRFDVPFPIPEKFLRQLQKKNPKNKPTVVQVAFQLDEDNAIVPLNKDRYLYAFLPTQMPTNLRFLIQARYHLITARTQIKDIEWNTWLIERTGEAFGIVLTQLREMSRLQASFYDILPHPSDLTEITVCFMPIASSIADLFSREPLIRTDREGYVLPSHGFLADKEIRSVLPMDDLKELYGEEAEYIDPKIGERGKRFLKQDNVGVREITLAELVRILSQNALWLERKNTAFFRNLFAFLYNQKEKLSKFLIERLKAIPLVPVEPEGLARCDEGSLYFPVAEPRGEIISIEGLRFVSSMLFSPEEKDSEEIRKTKTQTKKFLKEILGILDANPYEIIENHILPMYETGRWKEISTEQRVAHVRYIHHHLEAYKQGVDAAKRRYEGEAIDHFKRLRETLLLQTIHQTEDGKRYYGYSKELYFSKYYEPPIPLEPFFENSDEIWALDPIYIERDKEIKNPHRRARTIERWRAFFATIGVEDKLRVLHNKNFDFSYLKSSDRALLRHFMDYTEELLEDWVPCATMAKVLEGALTNPNDKALSEVLLKMLDENWESYFDKTKLKYEWRARIHWYFNKSDSTFLHKLRNSTWIPTTRGGFARPRDAFLDRPEIRRLLGDSVPYVTYDFKNQEFVKALQIRTEASLESVLEHLRDQVATGCTDSEYFNSVYYFFARQCLRPKRDSEAKEPTEALNHLRTAFRDERLIYVSGHPQQYFSVGEVVWSDISDIFGDLIPFLETEYEDLKEFFLALGVQLKPGPETYARALVRLPQQVEVTARDRRQIAKIYEELDEWLDPKEKEPSIASESWWSEFIEQRVFLTFKGTFERRHWLYVNDNREVADLFSDVVDFLWLPQDKHPDRFRHLIQALEISRISSIPKQACILGQQKLAINLDRLIEQLKIYIVSFLWSKHQRLYGKWKGEGILSILRKLRAWEVNQLQIMYEIYGVRRSLPHSVIIHDGQLYVQTESLEDTDLIAIELAKLFESPPGLAEFITTLFDKGSTHKIQRYLELHGIQLPEEEKRWFQGLEVPEEIPIELEEEKLISTEEELVSAIEIKEIEGDKTISERDKTQRERDKPPKDKSIPPPGIVKTVSGERQFEIRVRQSRLPISDGVITGEGGDGTGIGDLGVSKAMEYERIRGRKPENVSKKPNIGYDIRSEGTDGIRYIEVKSSLEERTAPIELQPSQFLAALRYQEDYFLYVIEHVETDPLVHEIPDPAKTFAQDIIIQFENRQWRVIATKPVRLSDLLE